MSRHRDAVVEAVDELRVRAARSLDITLLGAVQSNTTRIVTLDLLGDLCHAPFPVTYVAPLHDALAAFHVDELKEAQVILTAQSSLRQAACAIEGNIVTHRNLQVADVVVRARLRTRWVDIWRESNRRIEWPTAQL